MSMHDLLRTLREIGNYLSKDESFNFEIMLRYDGFMWMVTVALYDINTGDLFDLFSYGSDDFKKVVEALINWYLSVFNEIPEEGETDG